MGRDKATIVIGGASLAERAAATLRAIANPLVSVGPEAGTGLPAIDDRRLGPLAAFDTGCRWLRSQGFEGPVIALACDMPLVTAEMLRALMNARHGADAAVPIANGRLQPLAAVYGPNAVSTAARLVHQGARSMRELLAHIKVEIVPAEKLGSSDDAFDDLDTPADLERASAMLQAPA